MKTIFQLFVLIVPVFFSGQGISRNDSLTLAKLYDEAGKVELQADSLAEKIIEFIESVRDVSTEAHVWAVSCNRF